MEWIPLMLSGEGPSRPGTTKPVIGDHLGPGRDKMDLPVLNSFERVFFQETFIWITGVLDTLTRLLLLEPRRRRLPETRSREAR